MRRIILACWFGVISAPCFAQSDAIPLDSVINEAPTTAKPSSTPTATGQFYACDLPGGRAGYCPVIDFDLGSYMDPKSDKFIHENNQGLAPIEHEGLKPLAPLGQ